MSDEKKKYAERVYTKWNVRVAKAFGGASPKERFALLLSQVASAFCAFVLMLSDIPLFAKALGSPLCDAYLCASGKFAVGAFAGAMYGAYVTSAHPSEYIIFTLVFVIRFMVSKYLSYEKGFGEIFSETPILRLSACAVMCMVRTVMQLTQGEISRSIWGTLSYTLILAPTVCALMLFWFSGFPSEKGWKRVMYYVSMLSVFAFFVRSAAELKFAGGNVGLIAAVFLTLAASKRGGAVWGCVVGAILGLCSLSEYTAAIAIIGAVSGMFFSVGVLSTAGAAVVCGSVAAVLINGVSAVYGFVPEAVLSVAISSPIIKYEFLPVGFPFPQRRYTEETVSDSEKTAHIVLAESSSKRLKRLSGALSELSKELDSPRKIYDSVASDIRNEFCESCPMSPICWENEKDKAFAAISELVRLNNSCNENIKDNMPGWLSERCVRLKDLCSEAERRTSNAASVPNKDDSVNGLFEISEMLAYMADDINEENQNDSETERRIARVISAHGMRADSVCVLGKKRKRVYAYGMSPCKNEEESEKLRKAVSEICGEELLPPVISDGRAVFLPAEAFATENCHIGETKEGEMYSGDKVNTFVTDSGEFYAVLTDGMGSGAEAAECSDYASSALEKLLLCGLDARLAVRMLGRLMKKRFGECFAAIDIMKIDLVSGKTEFLKSGAACSYVVRNGSVYCVASNTMPVGITSESTPEEISFELRGGDTVVMVSDGICSDSSESWISAFLSSGDLKAPDVLASELLQKAVSLYGKTDDMTVSVTKIQQVS